MSFAHLHNHTEYSLLDGISKINQMVNKAKNDKQEYVSITDHGNMFGAVEFYTACKKAGVKPIIGIETYITHDRHKKEKIEKDDVENLTSHLILLAKNETGYKNLMKLSTIAYIEGFYYKPRIDNEILMQHSDGLIGGSACLQGKINRYLSNNDYEKAKQSALEYQSIFGKDNFFLEIMRHDLEEQKQIEPFLIRLANETNIPLVATNDCHYLNKNDWLAQDILLCMQTGKKFVDKDRMRMSSHEFYFKTQEEMYDKFSDLKECVNNSYEIAKQCNLEIKLNELQFPLYNKTYEEDEKMLTELALKGLQDKFDKKILDPRTETYTKRLFNEINVIKNMKFCGYFLIVWDFINYAKSNSIPVGPGRGSAAGSLVSYCIGITDIDPIKYGLVFERFLNPERISMPDVDVDFCVNKRDRVIEYVKNKYGENNVSQISTFSTMSTKAAIKDVARVLDIDFPTINKATKTIDSIDTSIMNELKTNKEFKKEIAEIIKNADENGKKLLSIALKLENNKRHMSTHAAGIVISDKPITDLSPIALNDNTIVTQYSKDIVEATGLIKFDFLGLKNLTIIDNTLKLIKEKENIDIDWTKIDLNDQEVLEYLSNGNTIGIFQLESDGMQNLIKGLKPNSFEDLIALVALYRPGPLGSGMVKEFVNRKHGKSKIEYPLPQLEHILKETYGIMVYQEQVMQIANVLAGYSMAEADVLRKIMGKKQKEKIPKEREKFLDRCKQNNIDTQKAKEIFDMMEKFAEYGFNKSHSTAYAYIAFQTAYLKYYYPKYFILESLNNDIGDKENAKKYVEEAISFGINLAPPDINKSELLFTLENGNTIRFGFLAIESIGKAIADSILETRKEKGEFTSLQDFLDKINKSTVNIAATQNLIKAGCFDSIPPYSKDESLLYANKFYQEYKESKKRKTRKQEKEKTPQGNIFLEFDTQQNQEKEQEKDKITSSITNDSNDKKAVNELASTNKIQYEKSVLGVSTEQLNKQNILSQKLKYLGVSIERLQENRRLSFIIGKPPKDKIIFYGIIKSFNDFTSKNNNKIIDVDFHTHEKDVKLTVFNNKMQDTIKQIDIKNDANQILKIECDIKNYKGKESYIVNKIEEIDISKATNAVILKIDANKAQDNKEEILSNIKNIVDSEKHNKTHRLLFYIKKGSEHFTLHTTNTFVSINNETLNKLSEYADKVLLVDFDRNFISVNRINNQSLIF